MSALRIETITLKAFREILTRYPSTVPGALKVRDDLRYNMIPAQVAEAPKKGLQKDSLEQLVEWKLHHGTFRPSLLALVKSNDVAVVREHTRDAFNLLLNDSKDPLATSFVALQKLTNLRGIGPATASLLLSVAAPAECPFFSDELYRWCVWGDAEVKGKGRGWNRKIGYTAKEYKVLAEKVKGVRERLGVQAVEVEKVAWVLGKEGVDLDEEEGEETGSVVGEEVEEQKKNGEGKEEEKKAPQKKTAAKKTSTKDASKKDTLTKGTKRKADDNDSLPAPSTRRSTRLKQ